MQTLCWGCGCLPLYIINGADGGANWVMWGMGDAPALVNEEKSVSVASRSLTFQSRDPTFSPLRIFWYLRGSTCWTNIRFASRMENFCPPNLHRGIMFLIFL